MWDIIPFSFVADWFVGFEDYWRHIDVNLYQNFIDIKGVTYSRKDTLALDVDFSDLGVVAENFILTIYQRVATQELHENTHKWTFMSGSGVNIIDGVALILRKLFK